jgi:hypothetical protein
MRGQDALDGRPKHPIQLQEVANLDSFISTILNDINPTTRILLIKVRNRKRLDQLVSRAPPFEQKLSKRS